MKSRETAAPLYSGGDSKYYIENQGIVENELDYLVEINEEVRRRE